MGQVLPHPFAVVAALPDNIQGAFQVCPITKVGLLTFTGAFGVGSVDIPPELGAKLLEYLPEATDDTPPKQYA